MFHIPDPRVQERDRSVNSPPLLDLHRLDRLNPVFVQRLDGRIRQAPPQNRIVLVDNHVLREGRAHNEYLQYTMYYGIPAGICYIAGCFSVYLRGLKNRRRLDRYSVAALTAAFGYLTSAFVGNTKMLTTGLFLALLGLGFSVPAEEPEKSPET